MPDGSPQMHLFEAEQQRMTDGRIVVTPKRLVDGREIDVRSAARMLGFRDRETIYRMIDRGELRGWKPSSKRGNAKWRIDLGSVIDYKRRRSQAAESGEA